MKFFIILVAILAMAATANAQTDVATFPVNEKGEVSAVTPEVRLLMEQADTIIAETVQTRTNADKKVLEATDNIKRVIADPKATPTMILNTKMDYLDALQEAQTVRRPVTEAMLKVAHRYFNNVIAIQNLGKKRMVSDFGGWQDRVSLVIKVDTRLSDIDSLVAQTDEALKLAEARDAERWKKFTDAAEEMRKRDKEMREKLK